MMSDEEAADCAATISAALENLGLDLTSGDDSALKLIRSHTGNRRLTFDRAAALIQNAEKHWDAFAKDLTA